MCRGDAELNRQRWMRALVLFAAGALWISLWAFWFWFMLLASVAFALPLILLAVAFDVRQQIRQQMRPGC